MSLSQARAAIGRMLLFSPNPRSTFVVPLSYTASRHMATKAKKKEKDKANSEKTSSIRNPFTVLGVTPDATETEVREAFYRKAKSLHPDINPSPEAKEQFLEVQKAYKGLRDPTKRKLGLEQLAEEEGKSVEEKIEDIEVHWLTKKKSGPIRIWSERLEVDMWRASAMRRQKRIHIKNRTGGKLIQIKPHRREYYTLNVPEKWPAPIDPGPLPPPKVFYFRMSVVAAMALMSVGGAIAFTNYQVDNS